MAMAMAISDICDERTTRDITAFSGWLAKITGRLAVLSWRAFSGTSHLVATRMVGTPELLSAAGETHFCQHSPQSLRLLPGDTVGSR